MKSVLAYAVLVVALGICSSGAHAQTYTSLASALAAVPNNNATVFSKAVQAAELNAYLNVSSFTLFIPTDAAFLDAATQLNMTADQVLAQKDLLTVLLGYHASADVYPSEAALIAKGTITTLTNQSLTVVAGAAGTEVLAFGSNASIVSSFSGVITSGNSSTPIGAFYSIDTVLIPDLMALVDNTTTATTTSTDAATASTTSTKANTTAPSTATTTTVNTTSTSSRSTSGAAAASASLVSAAVAVLMMLALLL